jgi:hypothetical protein
MIIMVYGQTAHNRTGSAEVPVCDTKFVKGGEQEKPFEMT